MQHSAVAVAPEMACEEWTYAKVREGYKNARIDMKDWTKLVDNIVAFKPGIVVLLTGKMPRLAQVIDLERRLRERLPEVRIMTDFAMTWEREHISSAVRIAVVDDSRFKGTTLNHVCNRLIGLGAHKDNIAPFVVFEHADCPASDSTFSLPCQAVPREHRDDAHYRKFSLLSAVAPGVLPMPCDLEFPVFEAPYHANCTSADQIFFGLSQRFGALHVHKTTLRENAGSGLLRFSVNVCPKSWHNYKIRLYLDENADRMYLVPMAPLTGTPDKSFLPEVWSAADDILRGLALGQETFDGESRNRLHLYMTSLHFGKHVLGAVQHVMNFQELQLRDNASNIFGQKLASIIATAEKGYAARNIDEYQYITSFDTGDIYFWSEILHGDAAGIKFWDNFLKTTMPAPKNVCDGYFIDFFGQLAKQVLGENNVGAYALKSKPLASHYNRLRIGPTFTDLLLIMDAVWRKVPDAPRSLEFLHSKLSFLLDEHIDYGQIVPVLSEEGKRVFRKGEAPLFIRNLVAAVQAEHADPVYLTDNIDGILERLPRKTINYIQKILNMQGV